MAGHELIKKLYKKLNAPLAGVSPPNQAAAPAGVAPAAKAAAGAMPNLTIFSGYLGEEWLDAQNTTWQPLFFDAVMSKGMLVDKKDIEITDSRDDHHAAFGKRDYIWVQIDKSIRVGVGPPAFWLNGPFTRAGDFAASVAGGTMAPTGGILREATTPTCCGMKSR